MKLDDLLVRLPKEAISHSFLNDPECDITNVSFLTDWDIPHLRSDILYFSDSSLLPNYIEDDVMFNCIIVDECDTHELEARNNVNLVWLNEVSNFYVCYNKIQSVFLEDRKLTHIVQRLLTAHFSNQGLQYLIEEAANALENPIVVVDPAYRYIAYHLGISPQDESQFAHIFRKELSNETVLDDAITYIRDSRIDSQIARSKGPYIHFNTMLQCNTMTIAVMIRKICMAHVMMVEYNHPFNDLDKEVFIRLASFVGQELQKSEVWGPTSGELGSYFLGNLISDQSPSTAVTLRRLKSLNFNPKPLLFICCFHTQGEGLSSIQTERIACQLKPILHHCLYTRYHQQLIVLISRDISEGISLRTEQKIREVATLNSLTVGISNGYTSITETRQAYLQARAAIRYGEQWSNYIDDQSYFKYSDYTFMHMLAISERTTNLLGFCHPALLNLLQYDRDHSSDFMETLYCYLQLACSTSRASKLLNLHKNTMLYRLGRIREILQMQLSSGDQIFSLQMSFRILISLGLFTPNLKFNRYESLEEQKDP